ncbi:hypothetical protein C2W62_51015, partial [Candidatus Entotheonella serta]
SIRSAKLFFRIVRQFEPDRDDRQKVFEKHEAGGRYVATAYSSLKPWYRKGSLQSLRFVRLR